MEIVVTASMRYDTVCRILVKDDEQLEHCRQIVLQCNTHVEDMRRWLYQNGFTIDAEQLVKNHHYYQMLFIHKEPSDMQEDRYLFGVHPNRCPLFKEHWTYILEKQRIIIQHIQPRRDRYAAATERIKTIEKKLREPD